MASVKLQGIYKKYPGGVVAVSDFNLEIKDKEFVILVGPSGCGKSTTLRMIAGLEEITEGQLFIGDKYVNDIAPKDRDIAMVFQNYAALKKQQRFWISHTCLTESRRLCPVVSVSVLPWVVPSSVTRRSSSSMNRCPTSTQNSVRR